MFMFEIDSINKLRAILAPDFILDVWFCGSDQIFPLIQTIAAPWTNTLV